MIVRLLMALSVLVFARPDSGRPVAQGLSAADVHLLSAASVALARSSPATVQRQILRSPGVSAVTRGVDGQTMIVEFRDGFSGAILPPFRKSRLGPAGTIPKSWIRQQATNKKALILEPFATELQLGSNPGGDVLSSLQSAGFSVDRLIDRAVTVSTMDTLGGYQVVYIDTHSGVNQYGEGVLATGTVYNADPTMVPYLKDGSVMTVSVAGSPLLFYGVVSRFVQEYEGTFPAGAIVDIDGCGMLLATRFWQALHQKGAATMISWDGEVVPSDAVSASALLFADLANGQTVDQALADVQAHGLATSSVPTQPTAHLGYLGDGRDTLNGVDGAVSPATSTPAPSPTVSPPPSATPTPAPQATRALVPPALALSLKSAVLPGAQQVIDVKNVVPNSLVRVQVTYPTGRVLHAQLSTGGTSAVYRFRQPASSVTPASAVARVRVVSGAQIASGTYRIAYSNLDLDLERANITTNSVRVWVHTQAAGHLTATVKGQARTTKNLTIRRAGWHPLSANVVTSRNHRVNVNATFRTASATVSAQVSLVIR